MGISRWGSKVEQALSKDPEPEPDIQEQISLEARRLEIEQVSAFISDWVQRRLSGTFYGASIHVRYDAKMAWYEAGVDFRHQGKTYSVVETVRDEDIDEKATSTKEWSAFLDRKVDVLKDGLRRGLMADGVRSLPMANREEVQLNFVGGSFSTAAIQAGKAIQEMGQNMSVAAERIRLIGQSTVDALEERSAIESIKRTISGQSQEPGQ